MEGHVFATRLLTLFCVLCVSLGYQQSSAFMQNSLRICSHKTGATHAALTQMYLGGGIASQRPLPRRLSSHHRPVSGRGLIRRPATVEMSMRTVRDVDDFPQIIEGVKFYVQEYDTADVPMKFVVPPAAPWPEPLWGLRLGRRVERLRKQKAALAGRYDAEMEELAALGVDWEAQAVDEWDLILRALTTFHELEGNCRVPAKFVVPREEPWPEACAGLRLGTSVASIRSVGRYVKNAPDRVEALDELGFEWRLRARELRDESAHEEWELIVEAVALYQQEGDINEIAATYIVPQQEPWPERTWGLPLGDRLGRVKQTGLYLKGGAGQAAERRARLEALGVRLGKPKRTSGARWDRVYAALTMYKELYLDLNVPQQYVVPSEAPWDEELWGMRLGNRVNTIRAQGTFIKDAPERRRQLEELGFEFDGKLVGNKRGVKSAEDLELEERVAARLEAKKAELLKQRREEEGVEGPLAAFGFSGLDGVYGLGAGDLAPADVAAGRGVPPPPVTPQRPGREAVLAALRRDNMDVEELTALDELLGGGGYGGYLPEERDLEYPEHGVELPFPPMPDRHRTNMYAEHGAFQSEGWFDCGGGAPVDADAQRVQMEALEEKYWEKISYAPDKVYDLHYPPFMQRGKRLWEERERREAAQRDHSRRANPYRDAPRRVPSGDLMDASFLTPEEQAALEAGKMGFVWDEFGDGFDWDEVVEALEWFTEQEGPLVDLPEDFEVPYDFLWPRHLAGLDLAGVCARLRTGDIDGRYTPERRKVLDALGFDWREEEHPEEKHLHFNWNKLVTGLYTHKKMLGHCLVDLEWTVPDQKPWPISLYGLELGELVNMCRWQKYLIWYEYPERYSLLWDIGFWWGPPIFEPIENKLGKRLFNRLEKHRKKLEQEDGGII